MAQWAREMNINYGTLQARVNRNGWDIEDLFRDCYELFKSKCRNCKTEHKAQGTGQFCSNRCAEEAAERKRTRNREYMRAKRAKEQLYAVETN